MGLFSIFKKKNTASVRTSPSSIQSSPGLLNIPPPPQPAPGHTDIEGTLGFDIPPPPHLDKQLPGAPGKPKMLPLPPMPTEDEFAGLPQFPELPKPEPKKELKKSESTTPLPSFQETWKSSPPSLPDLPLLDLPEQEKNLLPQDQKMQFLETLKPEALMPQEITEPVSREKAEAKVEHYIEIEAYATLRSQTEKIKNLIQQANTASVRLHQIHSKQKAKMTTFKRTAESMQKRLVMLDKTLFETKCS